MKTPYEKYMNDPAYHNLVNWLEVFIEDALYTPSELREACILACIHYERRHVQEKQFNPKVQEAFRLLDDFMRGRTE